jgi:hypothetical protein
MRVGATGERQAMNDDDEKIPAPVVWGILSPILDWTPEQRAAAEPKPESNVIYLADYKLSALRKSNEFVSAWSTEARRQSSGREEPPQPCLPDCAGRGLRVARRGGNQDLPHGEAQ